MTDGNQGDLSDKQASVHSFVNGRHLSGAIQQDMVMAEIKNLKEDTLFLLPLSKAELFVLNLKLPVCGRMGEGMRKVSFLLLFASGFEKKKRP